MLLGVLKGVYKGILQPRCTLLENKVRRHAKKQSTFCRFVPELEVLRPLTS